MPRLTFDVPEDTHRQLKELAGRYNIGQHKVIGLLIQAEWQALQNQPRLAALGISRPTECNTFTEEMDTTL